MKAAVIGYPIAHSKSPLIHQYWLDQYKICGTYNRIDIAPEDLGRGIQTLIDQEYSGFNVTIPHKENILALCNDVDETAQKIGAVNTVIIKDGKINGTNTDAFGFIQNIKTSQPKFNFKDKSAFILGAGGASRAIIFGLLNEGVSKILLCNRTKETAKNLASIFGNRIEVINWENRENKIENIDILVNTTALGMVGKPILEMDLSVLSRDTLVCDIVYTPLITDLLQQAKSRGNKIVTGSGMLLHQARPAFELWTGVLPEVTNELEVLVLK